MAVGANADTLFLCIIGGAISAVSCRPKRSCVLKPLSTKASPWFRFSRKPLTLTIYLSLVLPLYNFETKLKCIIEDIEISNLGTTHYVHYLCRGEGKKKGGQGCFTLARWGLFFFLNN